MKLCPECAFNNEERFPTCIWCNAVIVHVKSTPAADPNHPEHARHLIQSERQSRRRAQHGFAALSYAAVITGLVVFPGMISDWSILSSVFVAAGVIGLAMIRGTLGEFTAMFFQGAASVAILLLFDHVNFLIGFTLAGHVVLPAVFHQWVSLIDGGHC